MNKQELLSRLEDRFNENMHLHKSISWKSVEASLSDDDIQSLIMMEENLGEPDVVKEDEEYFYFFDTVKEMSEKRTNITYDQEAQDKRQKENLPILGNAQAYAAKQGTQLLDETDYFYLQSLADFDLKTSVWIDTPEAVRKKGGALFGDKRYGRAFIYHNGAQSFYKVRGYRTKLIVKK